MNAPQRQFTATDGKRSHVPLLVGLTGPSSSGKTFTALRLATGIQEVAGGDIYFIDTESRRALHYADRFSFKHVPFDAPFGSLDYLEALKFCVGQGAGVVIVDSMSHEHEGPGGMVDLHDTILDRIVGDGDWRKRQAMQMLAWSEPKQNRRKLINGILQLNANFIFCFRAKNTSKPVKKDGKTEVEAMGFMPIAGEEFVFEMTLNALLLPGSQGVPTWHPENPGERVMVKLPEQFRALAERKTALSEAVGRSLAKWARGDEIDSGDMTSRDGPMETRGSRETAGENADHSPAEKVAQGIIARADAAKAVAELEEIEAEAGQHTRAMSDELAAQVDQALNNASRRIHAAAKETDNGSASA